MNTVELRVAMTRKQRSRKDMAGVIGRSVACFAQKEIGRSPFTDDEKVKVALDLGLDWQQFNTIFYDGALPYGEPDCPAGEHP